VFQEIDVAFAPIDSHLLDLFAPTVVLNFLLMHVDSRRELRSTETWLVPLLGEAQQTRLPCVFSRAGTLPQSL